MANKKINQFTLLTSVSADKLVLIGDPLSGELFAAPVALFATSAAGNKNETLLFTGVAQLTLAWDAAKKAKYGDSGKFYVEIVGSDGVIRNVTNEIVPDSLTNTTSYVFNFGGTSTGRITIF